MKKLNSLYVYYYNKVVKTKQELVLSLENKVNTLAALKKSLHNEVLITKLNDIITNNKTLSGALAVLSPIAIGYTSSVLKKSIAYITVTYEIENIKSKIQELANQPYKEGVYNSIVGEYMNVISSEVLAGRSQYLERDLGYLEIVLKDYLPDSKVKIDWNESLSLLLKIAEVVDISLANSYKTKQIRKCDFIDAMKKHTYSESNPSGYRWLVHRQDKDALWWVWRRRKMNIQQLKFDFIPTNYINTKQRSQIHFASTAKTEDDISLSYLLGNRDKLNILRRFDPLVINRYKHKINKQITRYGI